MSWRSSVRVGLRVFWRSTNVPFAPTEVQAVLLSDILVFLQDKDQKYIFASLVIWALCAREVGVAGRQCGAPLEAPWSRIRLLCTLSPVYSAGLEHCKNFQEHWGHIVASRGPV